MIFVVWEEGGLYEPATLAGLLKAPIIGVRLLGRRFIFDRIMRRLNYGGGFRTHAR